MIPTVLAVSPTVEFPVIVVARFTRAIDAVPCAHKAKRSACIADVVATRDIAMDTDLPNITACPGPFRRIQRFVQPHVAPGSLQRQPRGFGGDVPNTVPIADTCQDLDTTLIRHILSVPCHRR